jgi:type I restriction enzyme M protein
LHDIEVPNVDYTDSLNREYTSIGAKDRVDVILANPPFGASVTDGVETNFPLNYRTTESADLFLVLMIRYLKEGGRAAIVLPGWFINRRWG